jgi:hypothetical protein
MRRKYTELSHTPKTSMGQVRWVRFHVERRGMGSGGRLRGSRASCSTEKFRRQMEWSDQD